MPTPSCPPRARPRASRGAFTLLEVLIALVVLAVALTALLSAQSGAIRLRTQAEEITLATFLLEARMADVELSGFPPVGRQEGDFGETYAGYRWQTLVSETPFPGVREVRHAVTWAAGPRPERLDLVHYMVDRQGRP